MIAYLRVAGVLAFCGICLITNAQQIAATYVPFTGRVIDESGAPIKDVRVHLMQTDGSFSSHGGAYSDDQGSFTLQLRTNATGVVFANDQGERVVASSVVRGTPSPVELQLTKKGRTLRGTVIDEAGQPVANALVGLSANARAEGSETSHRVGLAEAGMMKLTADANGNFETDRLPAMPIIVWAAKPGDEKGLRNLWQYSAKPAVLDLGSGDVMDYQAKLDPPPAYAPRQ